MKSPNNSSKEIEETFLLPVKVSLDVTSLKLESSTRSELEEELTRALVWVYSGRNRYGKTQRIIEDNFEGDVYEVGFDESNRLLIHQHETGPEVFLIPIAYFLGTAIVSGIVGNLAYDLLQDLYKRSNEALKKCIESNEDLEKDENRHLKKVLQTKLEIRLETPDGTIIVRFDPKHGLPPELAEHLTRRIIQYQKENFVKHNLKRFIKM